MVIPEKRKNYLFMLDEIQHTSGTWRFRKMIGNQIGDLATLFDAQTVYSELIPYFVALIQDPVAKIRKLTYKQVTKILDSLTPLPAKKKRISGKNLHIEYC